MAHPQASGAAPPWLVPSRDHRRALVAALIALTVLALLVRLPLLDFESGDYGSFLRPWYDHIRERGFTAAMGERFSDYAPPYLYLLALATHLPFSPVVNIKLIELPFDALLALGVMLIVRERRKSALLSAAVYGAVLFLPTVVWNGARWGQCDAIFTSFVLFGVLFLLRGRAGLALLCLGAGFAFKGQAIFILPALVALTIKGRIPVRAWLLFPLPYLVAIIPAYFCGRPFWELLNIYRDQAELYHQLTLGVASVYQWLPNAGFLRDHGFKIATVVIGLAILVALHPRLRAGPREIVALVTFFALFCPFVMPRMHDRYFFIADVLSIAYVCYLPRTWYLPVLVVTASLFSYWPYLEGRTPIPLDVLTGLILLALAAVAVDLVRLAREASPRATMPA